MFANCGGLPKSQVLRNRRRDISEEAADAAIIVEHLYDITC
jgi:hypothetical protein